MESLLDTLTSLPVILGITLFIGIVILVKSLLVPGGGIERRTEAERRSRVHAPEYPFYDSEQELIYADRRIASDRRKPRYVITENQRI